MKLTLGESSGFKNFFKQMSQEERYSIWKVFIKIQLQVRFQGFKTFLRKMSEEERYSILNVFKTFSHKCHKQKDILYKWIELQIQLIIL